MREELSKIKEKPSRLVEATGLILEELDVLEEGLIKIRKKMKAKRKSQDNCATCDEIDRITSKAFHTALRIRLDLKKLYE